MTNASTRLPAPADRSGPGLVEMDREAAQGAVVFSIGASFGGCQAEMQPESDRF
ncbi:hypothetical protein BTZ20_0740 [Rhodococcus sp. MTM3W5.2]|nr:hypothetical protein BTZ20_0740 [Rhodococcus sp. MTM3W5.2]